MTGHEVNFNIFVNKFIRNHEVGSVSVEKGDQPHSKRIDLLFVVLSQTD